MAVAFAAALAVSRASPRLVLITRTSRGRKKQESLFKPRDATRCALPAQADAAAELYQQRVALSGPDGGDVRSVAQTGPETPKKSQPNGEARHAEIKGKSMDEGDGKNSRELGRGDRSSSVKGKVEPVTMDYSKGWGGRNSENKATDKKLHGKEQHSPGKTVDLKSASSQKAWKGIGKNDPVPSANIGPTARVADDTEEPQFQLSGDIGASSSTVSSSSSENCDSKSGSVFDMGKFEKSTGEAHDRAQIAIAPGKLNDIEVSLSAAPSTNAAGNTQHGGARKNEGNGNVVGNPPLSFEPDVLIQNSSDSRRSPDSVDHNTNHDLSLRRDGRSDSNSEGDLQRKSVVAEGISSEDSSKFNGTSSQNRTRIFSIEQLRRIGAVTKTEVSRLVTESSMTGSLRLPTKREFTLFAWETLLVVALIALLRTGVSRTLRWIHNRLDSTRRSTKGSFPYEQSVFECMQRPLEFVSIFTVGTALGEVVSRPLAATGLLRYIRTLRELGVILAATWFLLRWIDRIRSRFSVDKRVDKAQVDATSRVASVITIAISMLISLDTIGINVQKVLAFGGIGGVAIGFAGREIISNFFGGFMIFLTRPFSVGEWIRSIEEAELNGTVEDIGWYLTRVRTWDKRPLYIPNSRFSTLIVENPSRMTNRRICHTLHLRIEDMPVVTKVVNGIDQILKKHTELDPKQHRLAYIDSFDEFSVKIWLSCYTKSVFLFDFRRVQQEILVSVYGVLREHGARLATVTTRDVRPGGDPDRYGALGAASLRNRHLATPVAAPSTGIAPGIASRPGEDHFDGQRGASIAAEIESGLRNDDGAGHTNLIPVPSQVSSSPTSGSYATSTTSSSGNVATRNANNNAGSGANSATNESAGMSNANVGQGWPRSQSDKNSLLGQQGTPRSASEALEIAAAAIIAARKNQARNDKKQAESSSSSSLQETPGTGQNAAASVTHSQVPTGATSHSSTMSGSGTTSVAPSEESPAVGQMRITAAPPHGSTVTPTSGHAAPAAVLKDDTAFSDRQEKSSAPATGFSPGGNDAGKGVPEIGNANASTASTVSCPPTPVSGQMNISAARPKQKPSPPRSTTSANPSLPVEGQRSATADYAKTSTVTDDDTSEQASTSPRQSASSSTGSHDSGEGSKERPGI